MDNRKKEVEAALKAGLMPTPLTAEDVEKRRRTRSGRLAKWASDQFGLLFFVCLFCLLLGTGMIVTSKAQANGVYAAVSLLLCALGMGLFCILGMLSEGAIGDSISLRQSRCQAFLDTLMAIPNGAEFREAVLAQNREFLEEEYAQAVRARHRHVQKQAEDADAAGCRALYGVGKQDTAV